MPIQTFDMTPSASAASMIGNALGQGTARSLPDPQMLVQRRMLQQALDQAKDQINKPGSTPIDKMFAVMQAGAGIPGSERYLSSILPEVMKMAQAQASQNAPFGLPDQMNQMNQTRTPEARQQFMSENQFQRQDLPSFGQSETSAKPGTGEFFPSVQAGTQQPGNLPQAATSGVKDRVLSNKELIKQSKPYAKELTNAGIPTTPSQAYQLLKDQNDDIKQSNQLVEQERKEKIGEQVRYGSLGENALNQVLPEATPEQVALFKRKGEEFAGKNQSEADIERKLAKEASNFKNRIAQIKKSIPPARMYNTAYERVMGTARESGKRNEDVRQKIKPLLDDGLYDTARNLLAEVGYYPEEREGIISKLGEYPEKIISQMPRIGSSAGDEDTYNQNQQKIFSDNLRQVLQKDKSANLILLRKKYEEEKGVGWQLFKNNLNNMIEAGEFKPSDDQFNQLDKLEQPPLDMLDRFLYGIGLKGR